MEVIPAIDLIDGRCVRLYQGDFGRVSNYDLDPLALAGRWRDAGLRRLHVVDLDGARTGSPANLPVIGRLAEGSGLAVQAGGGIRSLDRAHTLLAAGADRVVLGSVAAEEPETALAWLAELGAGRFVAAFDVRLAEGAEPTVLTRGWQHDSGRALWPLVERYLAAGCRHFLCTDVSRDGTLTGPNVALYAECVRRFPSAGFIASGGVASVEDLEALEASGVAAVVTGKALLDGRITLEEMGRFSPAA